MAGEDVTLARSDAEDDSASKDNGDPKGQDISDTKGPDADDSVASSKTKKTGNAKEAVAADSEEDSDDDGVEVMGVVQKKKKASLKNDADYESDEASEDAVKTAVQKSGTASAKACKVDIDDDDTVVVPKVAWNAKVNFPKDMRKCFVDSVGHEPASNDKNGWVGLLERMTEKKGLIHTSGTTEKVVAPGIVEFVRTIGASDTKRGLANTVASLELTCKEKQFAARSETYQDNARDRFMEFAEEYGANYHDLEKIYDGACASSLEEHLDLYASKTLSGVKRKIEGCLDIGAKKGDGEEVSSDGEYEEDE